MRGNFKQLPFRKNKGKIESNKDALKRFAKIKDTKKKIKENKKTIDKKVFEFKMYRNKNGRKMELYKKANDKIEMIDFEIRKLERKLENEFIAEQQCNTKTKFINDKIVTKKLSEKREISDREALLRNRVNDLKYKKAELLKFL